MIGQGRDYVFTAWWLVVLPGLMIFVTAWAACILGDEASDRLSKRS